MNYYQVSPGAPRVKARIIELFKKIGEESQKEEPDHSVMMDYHGRITFLRSRLVHLGQSVSFEPTFMAELMGN